MYKLTNKNKFKIQLKQTRISPGLHLPEERPFYQCLDPWLGRSNLWKTVRKTQCRIRNLLNKDKLTT